MTNDHAGFFAFVVAMTAISFSPHVCVWLIRWRSRRAQARLNNSYSRFIKFCRFMGYAEPTFDFFVKYLYKKKYNCK